MTDPILTPERQGLVERMAALGPTIAQRSEDYDRDARFPYENWADFRDAGLLGICIPVEDGGLGGDFVGYALTAEELGRHCLSTALTFNMHVATTLLTGQIADDMDLPDDERTMLHTNRAQLRRGIIEDGTIHSQPFSEGLAAGATAGFATRAVPVEGGYRVTGRKIFASLSGAAGIHNVVCSVEGDPRLRLLGIPADGEGVHIEGEWDPLGARATDSRNLVMRDVFVPVEHEWIPPGPVRSGCGALALLLHDALVRLPRPDARDHGCDGDVSDWRRPTRRAARASDQAARLGRDEPHLRAGPGAVLPSTRRVGGRSVGRRRSPRVEFDGDDDGGRP